MNDTQTATPVPVEELTFRQGASELEGIVAMMESNTLELEDSLAQYMRGVELIRGLRAKIDDAVQTRDVLMGQLTGEVDDEQRDSTLS